MAAPEPTISRIQLGMELQQLRERADKEREEVAEKLGWYPAKVSKVEQGGTTVSAAEVDALLVFLDADDETSTRVRRLGAEARKRGSYGKVSDWARTYVGMEAGASEIMIFAEELIPGLLQTEDYAREIAKASVVTKAADIDHLVKSRVERRNKLHSDNPPLLSVILGEAALRRLVGGPAVMRQQLELLREVADLQHVTLQVLPFSSGAHASVGTSFTVLTLRNHSKRTVYIEDITNADYLDRRHHVDTYNLVFDRLRMAAAGMNESAATLNRVTHELSTGR
jgi:transcriptional regulator with XRE-family HTH domain